MPLPSAFGGQYGDVAQDPEQEGQPRSPASRLRAAGLLSFVGALCCAFLGLWVLVVGGVIAGLYFLGMAVVVGKRRS